MRQFVNAAVILVVAAVVIGFILMAIAEIRGAAYRAHCRNNLKMMFLALHDYAGTHQDKVPLAAIPNDALPKEKRLSWMVELLPNLEMGSLYRKTNTKAAWDDPVNAL